MPKSLSVLLALLMTLVLPGLLISAPASAHVIKVGDLVIVHPWSRASASPAVKTGVLYVTIKNNGTSDDRLLSVSTTAAESAELHSTSVENGVNKMRKVDGFDLKAGGSLVLAPGGNHIMLIGLKAPLKQGSMVPFTFTFAKAGAVAVPIMVLAPGAVENDAGKMGDMPGMKMN